MYFWTSSVSNILAVRERMEQARRQKAHLERLQVRIFCDTLVFAMQLLAGEFERHGRHVEISRNGNMVAMTVSRAGEVEFRFSAAVSRRRRPRKKPGRHTDRAGYAYDVDRVYSLKEARKLGADQVRREIVAHYRRQAVA